MNDRALIFLRRAAPVPAYASTRPLPAKLSQPHPLARSHRGKRTGKAPGFGLRILGAWEYQG